MVALNALRPAVHTLIRNLILIAIVGLYGFVQLLQLALQPTQPIVAAIVSLEITSVMIVVMPFFRGIYSRWLMKHSAGKPTPERLFPKKRRTTSSFSLGISHSSQYTSF